MFINLVNLFKKAMEEDWAKPCDDNHEFWASMMKWASESLLPEFLTKFSRQINSVIEINPDLPEREILEIFNQHIVNSLSALSSSIRIYDPSSRKLISYGSFPQEDDSRETHIPMEKSIAGQVIVERKTYLVPNILEEDLYLDKDIVKRKGAYSLMSVPLEIPRFFPDESDTVGVIQIYYPEKNRVFSALEINMAEVMANRLSFVIARKKIMSMYRVNEKKDAIIQSIFQKLGTWEGVKTKEIFNRVIPELADIINIQSCALFSVSTNFEHVVLEAGYPDSTDFHGIGQKFPVSSEQAFEHVLNLRDYENESPYEMVTQTYVLVTDPQKSPLVSEAFRQFTRNHNINSTLYIPLKAGEQILHFMTFDAKDQRKMYSPEEIEIFLFLGRELMKAQRIERLDDILHDFKNPAIAIAGFARRLKQMLEKEATLGEHKKIREYVDILFEETSRIQEMAMSISQVGRERPLDFNDIVSKRFQINKFAITEQLRQVTLEEDYCNDTLMVKCYQIQLERLLDNLLNNATNAIPLMGGFLSVQTFADGDWACVEVKNTGEISEQERAGLLAGETRGRGGHITRRIIRMLNGKIDIRISEKKTSVLLKIPLYRGE